MLSTLGKIWIFVASTLLVTTSALAMAPLKSLSWSTLAASSKKAVRLFEEHCNECHSVAAEGLEAMELEFEDEDEEIEISDLSGVGKKHDVEFLRRWLLREVEIDGEKHEKKFKGGNRDLDVIVQWLSSLQSETESD